MSTKVYLNGTIANHPFYGTTGDVLFLPDDLAGRLIDGGQAELYEAREARLAAEKEGKLKKEQKDQPVAEPVAEPTTAEVEKAVDDHMTGLDELFEKQQLEPVAEPVAEPVVEKKKK